jgi:hypothetical protein
MDREYGMMFLRTMRKKDMAGRRPLLIRLTTARIYQLTAYIVKKRHYYTSFARENRVNFS